MSANVSAIRVVARSGKKWFLDLPFQECLWCCSLCVFQKKPLYNLDWDPTDYQWKKPNASGNGKHLEFFQYSVKLGRNLLLESKYKCPAAMKHWTANNVNALQLTKFWKWLWSMQLPKKVICFRWLLMQYALPVGDWLRQNQQYGCGIHCGASGESILHLFWL